MWKAIVVALLLISSVAVGFAQVGTFVSPEFGFSMREPAGWLPADKKFLAQNLRKVEMTEAQLEELLKQNEGSVLLFAFVRRAPEEKVGLIPTIQARVVSTKLGRALSFAEFKPAILTAFGAQKKKFQDYEYIVEPSETEVGGIKSVYLISKYTLTTQSGLTYKVRSRSYAIPYRTYFFQISFVDELGVQDCSAEFDELVRSIKIGK